MRSDPARNGGTRPDRLAFVLYVEGPRDREILRDIIQTHTLSGEPVSSRGPMPPCEASVEVITAFSRSSSAAAAAADDTTDGEDSSSGGLSGDESGGDTTDGTPQCDATEPGGLVPEPPRREEAPHRGTRRADLSIRCAWRPSSVQMAPEEHPGPVEL